MGITNEKAIIGQWKATEKHFLKHYLPLHNVISKELSYKAPKKSAHLMQLSPDRCTGNFAMAQFSLNPIYDEWIDFPIFTLLAIGRVKFQF